MPSLPGSSLSGDLAAELFEFLKRLEELSGVDDLPELPLGFAA